jgi:hypothetical protein
MTITLFHLVLAFALGWAGPFVVDAVLHTLRSRFTPGDY